MSGGLSTSRFIPRVAGLTARSARHGQAHAASRTRGALAERFRSLVVRRGRKRAIFALAHQLLKLVFVLIDRGDDYWDATVDYEALSVARNAPRWLRMLRKHGFLAA